MTTGRREPHSPVTQPEGAVRRQTPRGKGAWGTLPVDGGNPCREGGFTFRLKGFVLDECMCTEGEDTSVPSSNLI